MKENRFFDEASTNFLQSFFYFIKNLSIFCDNVMQLFQLLPSELKETLSWNQHAKISSFRYNWFRSSIEEGKRNGNPILCFYDNAVPFHFNRMLCCQNDRAALIDSSNDIFLLTHPCWRTGPVTDVEITNIFCSKYSFSSQKKLSNMNQNGFDGNWKVAFKHCMLAPQIRFELMIW